MRYEKPHIYKRQILATGKYYIGKHKGGDKYYKGSGTDYKADLKKYKNFETEILEYVDNVKELNDREMYWLDYYDAANNPLFYNKTNKPFGVHSHTTEWKKSQSKRMKGKSTTKGKTWKIEDASNMKGGNTKGKTWKWNEKSSKERNEKISESLQNRDNTEWKNKIYTEERNTKISKSKGKGILQYDLEGNLIREWVSYGELKKAGYLGVQGAIRRGKPYKNSIWKPKN